VAGTEPMTSMLELAVCRAEYPASYLQAGADLAELAAQVLDFSLLSHTYWSRCMPTPYQACPFPCSCLDLQTESLTYPPDRDSC
jgi:hypothetical protein